jgi:hypothetical protein
LAGIGSREAARVACYILRRDGYPAVQENLPEREKLTATVDQARGQVAVFEGAEAVTALLAELHSGDPQVRLRAAAAVRPVVYEIPDTVVDAVCDAIRGEQAPHVLLRLLWASSTVRYDSSRRLTPGLH